MFKYLLLALLVCLPAYAGDLELRLNTQTGKVGLGEWIGDDLYLDYENPGKANLGDRESGLLYPNPGGDLAPAFLLPLDGDE